MALRGLAAFLNKPVPQGRDTPLGLRTLTKFEVRHGSKP
jgi:hypothetical protein